MCSDDKTSRCKKPEKLKGSPEECTPEEIAECHPDADGHPCVEDKKEKE